MIHFIQANLAFNAIAAMLILALAAVEAVSHRR
jgi:hypothetical protein